MNKIYIWLILKLFMVKKKVVKRVGKKVSKKSVKKNINKNSKFGKQLDEDIKEIEREVKQFEKWMIARRKFLIKLGIVSAIVALLLIISHYYLRVPGYG